MNGRTDQVNGAANNGMQLMRRKPRAADSGRYSCRDRFGADSSHSETYRD